MVGGWEERKRGREDEGQCYPCTCTPGESNDAYSVIHVDILSAVYIHLYTCMYLSQCNCSHQKYRTVSKTAPLGPGKENDWANVRHTCDK